MVLLVTSTKKLKMTSKNNQSGRIFKILCKKRHSKRFFNFSADKYKWTNTTAQRQ